MISRKLQQFNLLYLGCTVPDCSGRCRFSVLQVKYMSVETCVKYMSVETCVKYMSVETCKSSTCLSRPVSSTCLLRPASRVYVYRDLQVKYMSVETCKSSTCLSRPVASSSAVADSVYDGSCTQLMSEHREVRNRLMRTKQHERTLRYSVHVRHRQLLCSYRQYSQLRYRKCDSFVGTISILSF